MHVRATAALLAGVASAGLLAQTILLAQEDLVVEQSVFTPPVGTPFTTDRICWRERTLVKLDQ